MNFVGGPFASAVDVVSAAKAATHDELRQPAGKAI